MYYREILPIKALQQYIMYFWILEDVTNETFPKTFKIIPDGIPALIFQSGENLFLNHEGKEMPPLYLYGQSTTYAEHQITGSFSIMGAYLYPTSLKTLFNIDASELNNQNIALADIIKDPILEQLLNSASIEEKIVIISQFFLYRIQQINNSNKKAELATSLLQHGQSLQDIQIATNMSERSLERMMKQYVGLSPKFFSRIMRFQSSLNKLRHSDVKSFTELAYEANYFDQSHFIKDFKAFTGTSPKNFVLSIDERLANFPLWKD